jgi:hypothetical protein
MRTLHTAKPATARCGEPLRISTREIVERDDGMFDVIFGDTVAGPFPTRTFAARVASGDLPLPVLPSKFGRIKIREVRRNA